MTNTTDRRQGLIGDLGIKKSVRVATTAAITLEGLQTIDSVSLAEGDRVLVKNQTDLTKNGIYDASSGTWTRSLDFDGNGDIVNGTLVFVTSGSVNASRLFSTIVTDPITVDSSNIQFNFAVAFGDAGLIAANNLSDVPNKTTARDNLGLEIGVDIPSYFDVSKYASGNFYIDSSVAANTYVLTKAASLVNPVNGSNDYYIGMEIKFRPNFANTGASTVNVNSAGIKNLKKEDGITDLAAGDMQIYSDVSFRYNGTAFVRFQGNATTTSRGQTFLPKTIILSNNATTPNTKVDFAAGVHQFDNGAGQAIISAITGIIQSSGSWTAGNDQNKLDTGARANSTWYHSYIIQNNTTGAYDVLFSTSATSPTVPSGYTNRAKIKNGQVLTDSSGNIRTFLKFANGLTKYTFSSNGIQDYVTSSPAVQSNTLQSISVPNQTGIGAIVKGWGETGTTGSDVIVVAFDGSVISSISISANSDSDIYCVGDSVRYMAREKLCITNSAQIRFSITTSSTSRALIFYTLGYYDLT